MGDSKAAGLTESEARPEAKLVKAPDSLEGELQFLQDPIRKFKSEEQESIGVLLEMISDLCKIDPFLQQLDEISLGDRKKRIIPL